MSVIQTNSASGSALPVALVQDLTETITFTDNGLGYLAYYLDPQSDNLGVNPSGVFTAGFRFEIINKSSSKYLVFDKEGIAQIVNAAHLGTFRYDGASWY